MDFRALTRRLPLTAIAVAGTVAVTAATASLALRGRPLGVYYDLYIVLNAPTTIVLLWLARMVLRRRPGNGAGLVLLAVALVQGVHVVVTAFVDARLVAAGADLAAGFDPLLVIPAHLPLDTSIPLLVMSIVWVPAPALLITVLLLVFPDGRLPSRRWRPVLWLTGIATALIMTAFAIDAWPAATWEAADSPAIVWALFLTGAAGLVAAFAASATALARRWLRADAVQRRQFRSVGVAALGFAVVAIALYPWQSIWLPALIAAYCVLLAVYAFAVARLRLHDLEPVLGKAAVGAVLAALVTAVYLVIVVGAGGLVGRGLVDRGLGGALAPLVAVGLVALLVEPARRRTRALVDRLLYGRRVDRTEVLSRLAERTSAAADAESVLDEAARLLADSTGAARAEVRLDVGTGPELVAAAGPADEREPILAADVRHHGERLGELRLYAAAAADLVPGAAPLLADVAHALGVVMRNARLTAQLRARLEETRAVSRRLVEVHDRARRSLERDIHDGAQVRLIALRLRIGAAKALAETGDLDAVSEQIEAMGREVDAAVRMLRALAQGLHPPVLDQSGVAVALRSQLRDLPAAVTVTEAGLGRYRRAVEGALYFVCVEAAQNAVRHGGAERVRIALADDGESVSFRVRDDGCGFATGAHREGAGLSNIGDRVAALGGVSAIRSRPGGGTEVSGAIPVQPREAAR